MANDLGFARFPIELDLDAPADTVAQVGIANPLFPSTVDATMLAKVLPITGTGGKSKAVVLVFSRAVAV